jgi:Tfp pilus assembly protein PilV
MRRRRGTSYVEVLAAMVVLSFGLLSLVPLFALGVKVNASSRDLAVANTLAKEKLEQLIAYPSTDPRLAIPAGATRADETNSALCANDLPRWYKPGSGESSTQTVAPGSGWYRYPCTRTYTVQAFPLALNAPAVSTVSNEIAYEQPGAPAPYYAVKLVTVTVSPTGAMAPGLRMTRQSAYVRFKSATQ